MRRDDGSDEARAGAEGLHKALRPLSGGSYAPLDSAWREYRFQQRYLHRSWP
jgi:hypothetical protein